ncbi:hypothetical protein JK229_07630 [Pantoea dispersa]|uniref:hypothetical protein n=1 Tax=Pantoea dispersa TaxID=59814 RepID=UPI001BAD08B3|nr:hypothetical protein [Pantoea dispersa]MBS0904994.1 hypothetical protein [Pantoea dispersa]
MHHQIKKQTALVRCSASFLTRFNIRIPKDFLTRRLHQKITAFTAIYRHLSPVARSDLILKTKIANAFKAFAVKPAWRQPERITLK